MRNYCRASRIFTADLPNIEKHARRFAYIELYVKTTVQPCPDVLLPNFDGVSDDFIMHL